MAMGMVSRSILSADFAALGNGTAGVERGGAFADARADIVQTDRARAMASIRATLDAGLAKRRARRGGQP
jgi:hypothetical protein